MKAVLLSRYPRVDTVPWKRRVAEQLRDDGVDLAVVYSRSSLADQVRAGIAEFGPGVAARYVKARRGPHDAGANSAISLADWAREHDIAVSLHDRLGDPECLASLRRADPDLIILAGADIIPRAVLEIPRLGTLNAHYGLLPRYRGMNVTEWSVYHDDPLGVSVHWVDPGIDTGAIVVREPIEVEPGDTLAELRTKHQQAAARLLVEASRLAFGGCAPDGAQRPEDGRQYYRMHPELRLTVERKLARGEYRWTGSSRRELDEELGREPGPTCEPPLS
ncbi:MAG: formyl transferase [Actinomycetota bacterium]|nr:formyl transferase [Actinomycetota bacterium]